MHYRIWIMTDLLIDLLYMKSLVMGANGNERCTHNTVMMCIGLGVNVQYKTGCVQIRNYNTSACLSAVRSHSDSTLLTGTSWLAHHWLAHYWLAHHWQAHHWLAHHWLAHYWLARSANLAPDEELQITRSFKTLIHIAVISRSSQCSTTGVTKAVVCVIQSMGCYI